MIKQVKTIGGKKTGQIPGALVYVGEEQGDSPEITVSKYSVESVVNYKVDKSDLNKTCPEKGSILWINFDGFNDIAILDAVAKSFGIHSLTIEDIINTDHRAKIEEYDKYIFFVIKLFSQSENSDVLSTRQVSLILGEDFVLSFQEEEGYVFDEVRSRIKTARGRIRSQGADYLAYALLDSLVDSYFTVIEKIGDRIEDVEENLLASDANDSEIPEVIHHLKRDLVLLRKSISPLREIISGFLHCESELIMKSTSIYLRDINDHIIQLLETIQSQRDILTGLLDLYLSTVSQRMNEVMKILTIIATIFIPLTFIAGIYGMNFEFMPELKLRWAYPGLWGFMIVIFSGMVYFFRKKKWL